MLRKALFAALIALTNAASLTSLKSTDADLLKEAFFGGECWLIACTDVHDKKTGANLLEKALDDPKVSCRGASLQCGKKLPSGKTPLQRLSIEPPKQKGHPLLILCVNGEARPLNMDEYAKVRENSAAPDARVLAKTLVQAGLAPKPIVVNDDAAFNKQCAAKRHCLVISFNSSTTDVKAFTRAAAAVAAKRRLLRVVLVDGKHGALSLQRALPATPAFADEGAANHTRLAGEHDEPGVHLYVYGRQAFGGNIEREPKRFPARQTLEASQAVARQHGLGADQVVFAQQHPEAIDAGVFHNDVIAVGNGPVLLYHEMAFLDEQGTLDELRGKMTTPLIPVRVPSAAVSLDDAVSTYLFNSQLLSAPDGSGAMTLVVPGECQENEAVWRTIQNLLLAGANPISKVMVKDVKQSMRNGGGPACLRLRVQLGEEERAAIHPGAAYTPERHAALKAWAEKHYREELKPAELADPRLPGEIRAALDELTQLLDLGGDFYRFQRA